MVRALLSQPGIFRVFTASVLGRLPMGAVGLVFILRTRELTGSYAAGGLVAGVNALAHGIGSPLLGRVVDRRGQTAVLVGSGVTWALALAAFGLLPDGTGLAPALVCAAVAGAAFPPLAPCLRAIWSVLLTDPHKRHAAYSFEAVVFELVYIAGPLLLITAIGGWSLSAAAIACGAITLAGTLAFAAAPASRAWAPDRGRRGDVLGALRGAGVRVLLASLFLVGISIAAVEIAVAAFAEGEGMRGAVGPLLALWGLGSMIGGIVAGRRRAPADPVRRLALLFAMLGATSAPLALAGDVWALGALMVVAGLFIAPSLALAFGELGQVAPAGTVTEAYTWVATGFGGGIAAGSALGGWIVESAGTGPAFVLGGAVVIAAAGVIVAGRDALRASERPTAAPQRAEPAAAGSLA